MTTQVPAQEVDLIGTAKRPSRTKALLRRFEPRWKVLIARVVVLLVFLALWQFLPLIPGLSDVNHLFDSYFVSSPVRVVGRVWDLAVGTGGTITIWSYLLNTMVAALLGTVIGMVGGAALALVLSGFPFLSDVFRPFVVVINAIPRIALIPIVVIIGGISLTTSVVISVLVVFFVAFFSAYEGGTSISPPMVQNAQLLGANRLQVLLRVRFPYVLAWTFTALPLGLTFAIISVVTGEIMTGFHGMGYLITISSTTADSSLTFAVVVYLAIAGLIVVLGGDAIRARVLHWWAK